jgi:hypothetical protein
LRAKSLTRAGALNFLQVNVHQAVRDCEQTSALESKALSIFTNGRCKETSGAEMQNLNANPVRRTQNWTHSLDVNVDEFISLTSKGLYNAEAYPDSGRNEA